MGQKVHPTGIRLGIVTKHTSTWYADKGQYAKYLLNDLEVRDFLRKRLSQASISRIEIERRVCGRANLRRHSNGWT